MVTLRRHLTEWSLPKGALLLVVSNVCSLNRREIAQRQFFLPVVELCKSLGATYLEDMNMGRNAKHTSECFMQESIQAFVDISQDILKSLQTPILFSLH